MIKIHLKPFSTNESKTPVVNRKTGKTKMISTADYKVFEFRMIGELGRFELPLIKKGEDVYILFEFGFSSKSSDWDNPIKTTQDVVSKYLEFNDNQILIGAARKQIVKKGEEYIAFKLYKSDEIKDWLKDVENLTEDLK